MRFSYVCVVIHRVGSLDDLRRATIEGSGVTPCVDDLGERDNLSSFPSFLTLCVDMPIMLKVTSLMLK